jgi:uncharacterized membrane protein YhaH (DUF805 family)
MMTFGEAVRTCLVEKYVNFSGRARRSEFWWFTLFGWLVMVVLSLIEGTVFNTESGYGILTTIWGLAIILPSIGVSVRRLHDLDKSGWWLLLSVIPVIGFLVLLFWYVQQGTPGQNRFGADPIG